MDEDNPGDEQEPEQEGSADLEDPDNAAIPEINQDGFILVRNELGEIDYCYSTDGFISYYWPYNSSNYTTICICVSP